MSDKSRARAVQKDTAHPYMTALRPVRGEVALMPSTPDCLIQAALKAANVQPPPGPDQKPCHCPRCDP